MISEAYARFCKEYQGRVPLEGLQANQILRVRPTLDGQIKLVNELDEWSFTTRPGRGIRKDLAKKREFIVRDWADNDPPVPDWSFLDGNYVFFDDLPPEPTEDDPVFDFDVRGLQVACLLV